MYDPDDEAVACGFFHIERMSGKNVWLAVYTPTGQLTVHLFSKKHIYMMMEEE